MEDAAEALKLAFAVFAFVIALGLAFSTFSQSKTVSDIVISRSDRTYLESYTEADIESPQNGRIVGAENVIPTLYRYYKENYSIDIVSSTGKVKEVFDLHTETKYRDGKVERTDKYKNSTQYKDLFPSNIIWIGSQTNTDAKARIDGYISNNTVEINGEKVKAATEFNFNNLYYQKFEETKDGIRMSTISPEVEEYDGTYFTVESGTVKMNMTYTEK